MPLSLATEGAPMSDTAPPDVASLARVYGCSVFQAAYRPATPKTCSRKCSCACWKGLSARSPRGLPT